MKNIFLVIATILTLNVHATVDCSLEADLVLERMLEDMGFDASTAAISEPSDYVGFNNLTGKSFHRFRYSSVSFGDIVEFQAFIEFDITSGACVESVSETIWPQ